MSFSPVSGPPDLPGPLPSMGGAVPNTLLWLNGVPQIHNRSPDPGPQNWLCSSMPEIRNWGTHSLGAGDAGVSCRIRGGGDGAGVLLPPHGPPGRGEWRRSKATCLPCALSREATENTPHRNKEEAEGGDRSREVRPGEKPGSPQDNGRGFCPGPGQSSGSRGARRCPRAPV